MILGFVSVNTMQFITILETNHKENEIFIHYCQWTGNEEELGKLLKIIEFADPSNMSGDFCDFCYSEKKVSEGAVDEHIRLGYGCFAHTFQKHTGVFKCPDIKEEEVEDKYKAAQMLDECFYACRLGDYFKNNMSN
jgi:hypothetical protein